MKPTQEQVLQWAREAGFHRYAPDFPDMFEAFAAIAYEAGRKDENEDCAKVCDELEDAMMNGKRTKQGDYSAFAVGIVAERIRARREQ